MEILLCPPGEPVTLEPEPNNPADKNAIAVYSARGVQIGDIVADRTIVLRRAWEGCREVRAVFQSGTDGGAWIRVAFDGEPTLPPVVEKPAAPAAAEDWADDGFDGVDDIPPEE